MAHTFADPTADTRRTALHLALAATVQLPVLALSLWWGWHFGLAIGGGMPTAATAAVCLAACTGLLADWLLDRVLDRLLALFARR